MIPRTRVLYGRSRKLQEMDGWGEVRGVGVHANKILSAF